ncbi:hypothetical protein B7463_g7518, partial [Scytalidium lignicola]
MPADVDAYNATDKHRRNARKAGLQAKKDEQLPQGRYYAPTCKDPAKTRPTSAITGKGKEQLKVPLADIPRLLADDHKDYVPLIALASALEEEEEEEEEGELTSIQIEGSLYMKSTLEFNSENPYNKAVCRFLEQYGYQ